MNSWNKKWIVPIAFANIYIIWGLTFIAISFGLEGFPPFILSGLRFFIAGLVIFTYLRVKGERALSLLNWKKNAITGVLILAGGTGLVGWGEQFVSAPEAAIAIATGPFWFIAIDKKNWRKYFSDKWIPIGLVIGFVGLVLFLGGSSQSSHGGLSVTAQQRTIAFIVLAASSIIWVIGSLYSKNHPGQHSTFMNIAQQLLAAGIASFLLALFQGEWSQIKWQSIPYTSWYSLGFLVVFGSIVAYISYIWLLSVKDGALVSTHTYINPIVTVAAGWFISGHHLNSAQFIGLLVILTGVLLTNVTKYFKLTNRNKVKIRRTLRTIINYGQPYQPYSQFQKL